MRTMIGLRSLTCTVLLFMFLQPSATPQEWDIVDRYYFVKLKKPAYRHKKKVKIILWNYSPDTIRFYPEFGHLSMGMEKYEYEQWWAVDVFYTIDKTPHIIAFAPEKHTTYKWDQTMIDRENWPLRKHVLPGRYRIKFIYWKECHTRVPKIEGPDACKHYVKYSDDFDIY